MLMILDYWGMFHTLIVMVSKINIVWVILRTLMFLYFKSICGSLQETYYIYALYIR